VNFCNVLFGVGIYAIAYLICFKPGLFDSFLKYRLFIAKQSVKVGDWLLNLAICPLCLSILLTFPLSFLLKPETIVDYFVNLIGLFGVILIVHLFEDE
jgi:hypothetical protein